MSLKTTGNKGTNIVKVCKEDEILNPSTNRCVKRTGKIGKQILASLK